MELMKLTFRLLKGLGPRFHYHILIHHQTSWRFLHRLSYYRHRQGPMLLTANSNHIEHLPKHHHLDTHRHNQSRLDHHPPYLGHYTDLHSMAYHHYYLNVTCQNDATWSFMSPLILHCYSRRLPTCPLHNSSFHSHPRRSSFCWSLNSKIDYSHRRQSTNLSHSIFPGQMLRSYFYRLWLQLITLFMHLQVY
jgi:hypothetical protein